MSDFGDRNPIYKTNVPGRPTAWTGVTPTTACSRHAAALATLMYQRYVGVPCDAGQSNSLGPWVTVVCDAPFVIYPRAELQAPNAEKFLRHHPYRPSDHAPLTSSHSGSFLRRRLQKSELRDGLTPSCAEVADPRVSERVREGKPLSPIEEGAPRPAYSETLSRDATSNGFCRIVHLCHLQKKPWSAP